MASPTGSLPTRRVLVLSDESNPYAYSLVQSFAASPPEGTVVLHTEGWFLEALGDLPRLLRVADLVVVVWSATDPLWMAFQAGLARGFGLPIVAVAPTPGDADAAGGTPIVPVVTPTPNEMVARLASPLLPASRASTVRGGHVLLCPAASAADRRLLHAIQRARPGLAHRPAGRPGFAPERLTWVVTAYNPDTVTGLWENLDPNSANAFEAGRCAGTVARATGALPELAVLLVGQVRPVKPLVALTRFADDAAQAIKAIEDMPAPPGQLLVRRVVVQDFKCFERLSLTFADESPLGGSWTCIAGVNGAGKSSILQAVSLALLGPRHALQLGSERLAGMVRRTPSESEYRHGFEAEIRVTLVDRGEERELLLPLGPDGIGDRRFSAVSSAPRAAMDNLWERLEGMLVVAYGATRTISDARDTRWQKTSPQVRRNITLFDPLAQISSVEVLLDGGMSNEVVLRTLARLIDAVVTHHELRFETAVTDEGRLVFRRNGAALNPIDLPDGFRSVVALLADIATGWHQLRGFGEPANPEEIEGIVLVDELDLHLHASLQRQIVPRLRAALPNVQFIVSTHSPLVAASFDRSELVLLDQESPGGIRPVDRQILGFTADEVYEWLLDTPPYSEAGGEVLRKGGPEATLLLYQSPEHSEEAAVGLASEQEDLLEKLRNMPA